LSADIENALPGAAFVLVSSIRPPDRTRKASKVKFDIVNGDINGVQDSSDRAQNDSSVASGGVTQATSAGHYDGGDRSGRVGATHDPGHAPVQCGQSIPIYPTLENASEVPASVHETYHDILREFIDYLHTSQALQLSQSCIVDVLRSHDLQLLISESSRPETLQPRFVDGSRYETLQSSIVDEDAGPLLSIDHDGLWFMLRNGCLKTPQDTSVSRGGDRSGPVPGQAPHRFAQEPVAHVPEPQTPIVQLAPVATTTVTKDTMGDILRDGLDHIQRQMVRSRAWQEVHMAIMDDICPIALHAQYMRRWHERRPLQPRIVESIVDDGSSDTSEDAVDYQEADWVPVGHSQTSVQDSSLDADDACAEQTFLCRNVGHR
jgi:hypothetical protein